MIGAAAKLLPPAPASDSPLFAPAEEQVIREPRHCSVAFKNAGKTPLEPEVAVHRIRMANQPQYKVLGEGV